MHTRKLVKYLNYHHDILYTFIIQKRMTLPSKFMHIIDFLKQIQKKIYDFQRIYVDICYILCFVLFIFL